MTDNMKENEFQQQPMEEEIDLMELALKVWNERKLVLKACGIAALIGLVVAFSIPKEYTSTIVIAPESTSNKSGGGLSSLASLAGINMNMNTVDAIYPDLYPQIVGSVPFLTDLFDIQVQESGADAEEMAKEDYPYPMPLKEYMLDYQRGTWWGAIMSAPFKLLGWCISLFREEVEIPADHQLNTFHLTQEEADIVKGLDNRISITVDKKTGVATLSVMMQDPLIAATMADSVRVRLQEYVTEYRTNKARNTLEYTQKLYEDAKAEYYAAQAKYAEYADRNLNLSTLSARAEATRLENEQNLAYQTYTQMAQQLQLAKAKVDEITPVYTILQPASVPLKATKPSKLITLVVFIFLGGAISVGWILYVRDFLAKWRKKEEEVVSVENK